MKTVTVFQSPSELSTACGNVRSAGDKSVVLPNTVSILIDNGDQIVFTGQGAECFKVEGFGPLELLTHYTGHKVTKN